MGIDVGQLQHTVQHNCHVSDARHAGNYTLCVYLLKMREFYRWEKQLGFRERIDNQAIGSWLTRREALWQDLEEQDFRRIPLASIEHDPFDNAAINRHLLPRGMVYSAGYVVRNKPHFFLAELEQLEQHDDYRVIVSGREYARELTAPPAMSQGRDIFIRRESLRRTVWEKVEESLWNKSQSPLSQAVACYDFNHRLDESLQAMCDNEVATLVAHEIGEIQAGKLLGNEWQEMVSDVDHGPLELMLRAIRDNLADCLETLPRILERLEPARLHFFIANLGNMRKALFPGLRAAYDEWQQTGSTARLEDVVDNGRQHWLQLARALLGQYGRDGMQDRAAYQSLIERNTL